MSFQENAFSIAHLLGNVNLPRNISPLIRASKRRVDPDGSSSSPHYVGLSGKKLDLQYSDAAMVTQNVTVVFASNNYADAIASITAIDAANLEGIDLDGFLTIRNRNSGGVHFLKIKPQAIVGEESATVLGFEVDPFPGSISYAGEIASAPGSRSESNPQGTVFIARDEDLSSKSFNRAIASVLQYLEKGKIDLSREVVVVKSVAVTFQNNSTIAAVDGVAGGSQALVANVFTINDDTIRIPVHFVASTDPGGLALEEFFHLIRNGLELQLSQTDGGSRYRIKSVHYSTTPTTTDFRAAGNTGNTFAVWGTPDNKSIFGTLVGLLQKDKHASTAITEIRGNIIKCTGATFIAKKVQVGDTLRITGASSDVPFNHNGEFIVEKVWTEEILSVRAKSTSEPLVFSTDKRPTELNGVSGYGNATVPIGHYLPASNLVFTLERVGGTSWGLTTAGFPTATLLIKAGASLREVSAQAFSKEFNVPPDSAVSYIDNHIASGGHPATAISATAPTWARTSESVGGTTVQAILDNIIAMLSDNETVTTAEYGSSRIGSAAITGTAPDNTPRSLAAGSVKSQLKLLVEYLNNHMNDGVAHAGGGGNYSGSPNWFDATNIPNSVTLDGAVDRIVTDLGGSGGANGAAKIRSDARTAWLGGRTNPAASVFASIDKIITDLAVTTANDDGAERIGAQVTGDIPAGSVRSQLDYLAANWGKLSRANTWSAAQTFNGAAGDTSAAVITSFVPVNRKLIWEQAGPSGAGKVRHYVGTNGFEVTNNASWNGTQWVRDVAANATRIIMDGTSERASYRLSADASPWSESQWATQSDRVKAWGIYYTNGSGGFSNSASLNISSTSFPNANQMNVVFNSNVTNNTLKSVIVQVRDTLHPFTLTSVVINNSSTINITARSVSITDGPTALSDSRLVPFTTVSGIQISIVVLDGK